MISLACQCRLSSSGTALMLECRSPFCHTLERELSFGSFVSEMQECWKLLTFTSQLLHLLHVYDLNSLLVLE